MTFNISLIFFKKITNLPESSKKTSTSPLLTKEIAIYIFCGTTGIDLNIVTREGP